MRLGKIARRAAVTTAENDVFSLPPAMREIAGSIMDHFFTARGKALMKLDEYCPGLVYPAISMFKNFLFSSFNVDL